MMTNYEMLVKTDCATTQTNYETNFYNKASKSIVKTTQQKYLNGLSKIAFYISMLITRRDNGTVGF